MYTHHQKYGTDIYNVLCYDILDWCHSPDNSAYKMTFPTCNTHTEHPNFVSDDKVTPNFSGDEIFGGLEGGLLLSSQLTIVRRYHVGTF
jgi:hypothetical protein